MKDYYALLEPDRYYHVYNHAIPKNNLFLNDENYHFFLRKYMEYILPIADTFAYCLLPNHFHLAIRIKKKEQIFEYFKKSKHYSYIEFLPEEDISELLSKQFSNLFNSYTKSFNKLYERRGSLFERRFKRLLIDNQEYFRSIIHYIHFNPVMHGFVRDLRDWSHSSFEAFFSPAASNLKREEVILWFGNKKSFYEFHRKQIDGRMSLDLE